MRPTRCATATSSPRGVPSGALPVRGIAAGTAQTVRTSGGGSTAPSHFPPAACCGAAAAQTMSTSPRRAGEVMGDLLRTNTIGHSPHSLAFLGQGEDEQSVPAARVPEPGGAVAGKTCCPTTPAHAHGDVLPAVEAVGDRSRMVARAALKGPEGLAGLHVVGSEEPFGVAGEDEASTGRQRAG